MPYFSRRSSHTVPNSSAKRSSSHPNLASSSAVRRGTIQGPAEDSMEYDNSARGVLSMSTASTVSDGSEYDDVSLGDSSLGEVAPMRRKSGGLMNMYRDSGYNIRRQKVSRHKGQKKVKALLERGDDRVDISVGDKSIRCAETESEHLLEFGTVDPAEIRREKVARAKALKLLTTLEESDDRNTDLAKMPTVLMFSEGTDTSIETVLSEPVIVAATSTGYEVY